MQEPLKFNKKCFFIVNAIVLSLFVLIMVLTALNRGKVDLVLSKSLVTIREGKRYSGNVFASLVETFGEMPIYLIAMFCAYGIEYSIRDIEEKEKLINVIRVVILLVCLFAGTFMGHRLCEYIYIFFNGAKDEVWCKLVSLSLIVCLLSSSFLPLAKAISILTKASLKYALVATIVKPLSLTFDSSFSISCLFNNNSLVLSSL